MFMSFSTESFEFLMDFMDWDSYFVFNPFSDGLVSILKIEMRYSSLAAAHVEWWVPTVLFFFHNFL